MIEIKSPYPNYCGHYENVQLDDDEYIVWSVIRPPDVEEPIICGYVIRKKSVLTGEYFDGIDMRYIP